MTEEKKIAKPILAQLQVHFDGLIPRNLFLVKLDTKLDKVYTTYGSTAIKDNIKIKFIIKNNEGFVCDYFLDADGYTEHRRYFFETDQVEMLENFEGQFGSSEFEDEDIDYEEHRRIVKHNTEVRKILIKKRFLKK